MKRRPSVGCLYLVGALAAFTGFLAWCAVPRWFARIGTAYETPSDRALCARYLLHLTEKAPRAEVAKLVRNARRFLEGPSKHPPPSPPAPARPRTPIVSGETPEEGRPAGKDRPIGTGPGSRPPETGRPIGEGPKNRSAGSGRSSDLKPDSRPTDVTRLALVGHLRDLAPKHPDLLTLLAKRLNEEAVDEICLLGDFTLHDRPRGWRVFDTFLRRLRHPVLAVPGNHEAMGNPSLGAFRRRFGSPYGVHVTPGAVLLCIDSLAPLPKLLEWLDGACSQAPRDRPRILLCHHFIWTAAPPPHPRKKRRFHDFDGTVLVRRMAGKVRAIIAGDSKPPVSFGPIRRFHREGIDAYCAGMGLAGRCHPFVYYVARIDRRGEIQWTPREVALPADHPWYVGRPPTLKTTISRGHVAVAQ